MHENFLAVTGINPLFHRQFRILGEEDRATLIEGVQGCTTTRKPRLRSETLLRARGLDKVWFAAGKIRGIIEGAAS